MKATCEKLGCGEPATAQARFGEVTVARACPDHEPELIDFFNRHIRASEPGLVTQTANQNEKVRT